MLLLREHFTHYRPLVAATGLGVAAAVHDLVAVHLQTRQRAGTITRIRDNALITLGRAYAQINAALLAALHAQRLSESCDRRAEMWDARSRRMRSMRPTRPHRTSRHWPGRPDAPPARHSTKPACSGYCASSLTGNGRAGSRDTSAGQPQRPGAPRRP